MYEIKEKMAKEHPKFQMSPQADVMAESSRVSIFMSRDQISAVPCGTFNCQLKLYKAE